jgi:hypothetical protein
MSQIKLSRTCESIRQNRVSTLLGRFAAGESAAVSKEKDAVSDENEAAEEFGRRLVERTNSDPKQWAPLLHAAVALELCLERLVERLAVTGSLGAQEFLDILVGASDSIQRDPAGAVAVEKIEDLCRDIAAIPGVTLRAAKPAFSDEAAIPETPKGDPYDGSPL